MRVQGLLLAAGSGTRYGGPKALVPGWLAHSVAVLRDGGCDDVLVVVGAQADAVRRVLPEGVESVVADDWEQGMGASLRAGLAAIDPAAATDAVLVHLVDLPDVGADVVDRVRTCGEPLARASYDGIPGHPVLLAREHWAGVCEAASGDRGARDYLAVHDVALVECGDLATGADVDRDPTADQPVPE